jgi:aspartate racemase
VHGVGIPVINLMEEVARECDWIGVQRVMLLGTDSTMGSAKFTQVFAKHGIDAAGPQHEAARRKTTELIADLQQGKSPGAEERVRNIAKLSLGTKVTGQIAVCLACTELSLAFKQMKRAVTFQHQDILFINAAAVHVQAAFNRAVGQSRSAAPLRRLSSK